MKFNVISGLCDVLYSFEERISFQECVMFTHSGNYSEKYLGRNLSTFQWISHSHSENNLYWNLVQLGQGISKGSLPSAGRKVLKKNINVVPIVFFSFFGKKNMNF